MEETIDEQIEKVLKKYPGILTEEEVRLLLETDVTIVTESNRNEPNGILHRHWIKEYTR
jgi:hypothetical protein